MKKIIITLILFSQITIYAQSWSFKSGGNAFDGNYKTSSVKGKGTDFPYDNPYLVINLFKEESLNFYIVDAGYFQNLSKIEVLWIINNEPNTIYKSNRFSKSDNNKTLFFEDFINSNTNENLSKIEFIEKLKKGNNLNVRIKGNYETNDLSFSLKGSTKAIDYVVSKKFKDNLIAYQKEIEKIAIESIEEEVKIKTRILMMIHNTGINDNEWMNLLEKIEEKCKIDNIILKEIDTINIDINVFSTDLNLINKEGKILLEIEEIDTIIPEYIKKEKDKQTKLSDNNIKPVLKRLKWREIDSLGKILGKRIDREIILKFLKINKKQLDEYLKDCHYSKYFSQKASDKEVIDALLDCQLNRDKLNKALIKN